MPLKIIPRATLGTCALGCQCLVHTIPCHDRGHINIMLVLQSRIDSSESHATSSGGACNSSNIDIEEDIDVVEDGFIGVNEEAVTGIIEEEIAEAINFPDIKSEPNEVSYVCMSVIRHILPVSSNVGGFCDVSISGHFKRLHIWE